MGNPIAIVGAGLTGLVAARALSERGRSVVVFDKGRRPGGRMSTRTHPEPHRFDHGAQMFTTRDPAFAAAVAGWRSEGWVEAWAPRVGKVEAGELVEKAGEGAELFVGVPSMQSLLQELSSGLDVRSSTEIVSAELAASSASTTLVDAEGARLGPFSAVGLTAPAPQSARLAKARPELSARLSSLGYAPTWALLAAFDVPLMVPFDLVSGDDRTFRTLARDSAKPGRPAGERWVAHASDAWTEAHLEEDREEVATALVGGLEALLGARPSYAVAHRWRYATPAFAPCGVIGEGSWCWAGDGSFAPKVEGAYLAGCALADSLESV